ncbi:MAG: hypothetical protein QM705_15565 [Ancrocorticia sp.]
MEILLREDGYPTPLDHKVENIHSSLVGLSVDYLTRVASGAKPEEAFKFSLLGASILGVKTWRDPIRLLEFRAGRVDGLAIAAACELAGYDVAFRAGPWRYNPHACTTPDSVTAGHIKVMVNRSLSFFRDFGPATLDGFTFQGAFTDLVTNGDGDFLTRDTLWDFKVSVRPPTKDHTLQLLMYWLMGLRSGQQPFKSITHLGVFNPRLNTVYRIAVADVPAQVLDEVSREVIGYR